MAPKLSKNKGGKASKSDWDEGLSGSKDHKEVESSDTETLKQIKPTNLVNILQAIMSLKSDFYAKLKAVLTMLTDVKNEIGDCFARLTKAEERISQTEDTVNKLQSTAKMLQDKIKSLSAKTENLENSRWCFNVRLPEKAEGRDVCGFLGKKKGFLMCLGWNFAFCTSLNRLT